MLIGEAGPVVVNRAGQTSIQRSFGVESISRERRPSLSLKNILSAGSLIDRFPGPERGELVCNQGQEDKVTSCAKANDGYASGSHFEE